MAKKMKVPKAIDIKEISPVYGVSTDLLNAIGDDVKYRENSEKLFSYCGSYCDEFNRVYRKEYLLHVYRTFDKKKEQEVLKKMAEMDKTLLKQILSVDEGYKVAIVAEKNGAKISVQDVPITAIQTKEYVNYLASKKYNFEAPQTVNGIKTDFTDYHLAMIGYYENKAADAYDFLSNVLEKRNELIRAGKKYNAEKNDPKTTEQRKQELDQLMNQAQADFDKISKELPGICDEVNGLIQQYYHHANPLECAIIENKYVSEENIKKVNPDKLKESILGMNYRYNRMKKVNEFFNPKNKQTNTSQQTGQSLAEAEIYGGHGISGMLANAENKPAVYADYQISGNMSADITQKLAMSAQNKSEVLTLNQPSEEIGSSILSMSKGAQL